MKQKLHQGVRVNDRVADIVDRLKGAGPGIDLLELLSFYIEHPDDVPVGLDHKELVQYEDYIISHLL